MHAQAPMIAFTAHFASRITVVFLVVAIALLPVAALARARVEEDRRWTKEKPAVAALPAPTSALRKPPAKLPQSSAVKTSVPKTDPAHFR